MPLPKIDLAAMGGALMAMSAFFSYIAMSCAEKWTAFKDSDLPRPYTFPDQDILRSTSSVSVETDNGGNRIDGPSRGSCNYSRVEYGGRANTNDEIGSTTSDKIGQTIVVVDMAGQNSGNISPSAPGIGSDFELVDIESGNGSHRVLIDAPEALSPLRGKSSYLISQGSRLTVHDFDDSGDSSSEDSTDFTTNGSPEAEVPNLSSALGSTLGDLSRITEEDTGAEEDFNIGDVRQNNINGNSYLATQWKTDRKDKAGVAGYEEAGASMPMPHQGEAKK